MASDPSSLLRSESLRLEDLLPAWASGFHLFEPDTLQHNKVVTGFGPAPRHPWQVASSGSYRSAKGFGTSALVSIQTLFGSIAWAGSLSHAHYANSIARITSNVLRRFLDPTPIVRRSGNGNEPSPS
jgi:hypothetical protein